MKYGKLLLALPFTLPALSIAQETTEATFQPVWYWTLNLGKVDTSLNSGGQDFTYTNIGGSLGYRFSEILAGEFFVSFAMNDERDEFVSNILGEDVDTKFDAVGAYITAKSPSNPYVKARLGLVESRFTYSASGYEDEQGGDFGFSYGLGGGYSFNGLSFELDYVVYPEVEDPIFDSESYDSTMIMFSVGKDF